MADTVGSTLPLRGTPDRANDYFYVWNGGNSYRSTLNNELGITGVPVGTTDSQTLTNKTFTAPTISSPVLSGTITGTYTLAGTPTFPASVVTLIGTQTLTNKTLTSPTITTPTITNASITQDAVVGFTTANTGTVYGVSIVGGALSASSLPPGTAVQVASTNFSAVATGTATIPKDDTIPQITEGTEFMTQAITPKSTTNRLIIEIKVEIAYTVSANEIIVALFQDATANAIAATAVTNAGANYMNNITLTYDMVAGTISSTTFRVRIGPNSAGTITMNGQLGARLFGGVAGSNITITEYRV